ncbi:DUF5672 family protein [Bacteroides finegoldii]|uniref:DUF5672 family protein n=1 Tax=Bacteroides finegoldii TaxID=338188 RepID=UPI0035636561
MKKINDKKRIVVVIPIYRLELSIEESIALKQCVTVLKDYSLVIVKPESLNVHTILSEHPILKTESFPDGHFVSLRAYNKLVLIPSFYLRFQQYQYMLIYQLDAYVFKDELLYWANKGYDYIGAPWLSDVKALQNKRSQRRLLRAYAWYMVTGNEKRRTEEAFRYQVGNGGFSLRKISKMIKVTRFYKRKINLYMDDNEDFYPEDVFLLAELTNWLCRLRKPKFKEALRFSIETNPEWGYHYNHNELPFGCHDWNHPDYAPFWHQIIKF